VSCISNHHKSFQTSQKWFWYQKCILNPKKLVQTFFDHIFFVKPCKRPKWAVSQGKTKGSQDKTINFLLKTAHLGRLSIFTKK
jgi:hypothetical protein